MWHRIVHILANHDLQHVEHKWGKHNFSGIKHKQKFISLRIGVHIKTTQKVYGPVNMNTSDFWTHLNSLTLHLTGWCRTCQQANSNCLNNISKNGPSYQKLYVELGLVVTKLHRVLSFRQEKWLAPYVKLNTEKQKQAKNIFGEDSFKLMVSSSFGKTCEGKRNSLKVKMTRTEEETLTWTEKPEYQSSKIISKDLVTVCLQQPELLWDKTTIVVTGILELAKKFMFEFHYKVMKKNFDCNLLYSDTGSLCMKCARETFLRNYSGKSRSLNSWFLKLPISAPIAQQGECPCHVKIQRWDG